MKTMAFLISVLMTVSAWADVKTIETNEALRGYDLKSDIMNEIIYDYYDYDWAVSESEWKSLISESEFTVTEKKLSALPEGAETETPDKLYTTVMKVKVVTKYDGDTACDVRLKRVFGNQTLTVNNWGGIEVKQSKARWAVNVIDCADNY